MNTPSGLSILIGAVLGLTGLAVSLSQSGPGSERGDDRGVRRRPEANGGVDVARRSLAVRGRPTRGGEQPVRDATG